MEGFEYEVKLEDGVSGPAHAEVNALKALQAEIRGTEKSLHALQTEQLNYKRGGFKDAARDMALEIAKARNQLSGLKSDLKDIPKAVKPLKEIAPKEVKGPEVDSFGSVLFEGITPALLLTSAIEKIGDVALEAATKVAELGIEATKFAIEAAEFRENTELAYAAVQGTAEEGEATFKQLDAIAGSFHMPAKQAHQLARDLMLQGLEDTKLIGSSIEATAALMRTGQVQGAQKLQSIIEKSLASGHFDAGKGLAGGNGDAASGRALAGLGVHLPELLSDLAKRTGLSIGEVQAQLKAGKISTEVGVAALVDAINTGVVGKAAAAKYDIRDFTTDVGNYFTRMVQDVDLAPLEQSLLGVSSALGFVANRKDGVQGVFQTIIDWTGHAIEAATKFALDIEIAFLEAELSVMPLIKAIRWVVDEIGKVDGALRGMDKAIEKSTGGRFETGTTASDSFGDRAMNAFLNGIPGIGLVHVLAGNATSNAAKDMGINLGEQAVEGARIGADAHSPSDEMKDLGKDMSDGLGIGFSASSVTNSMRGGMDDTGGGSSGHSFSMGDINVNAPHADAHEVAHLVASQVQDAFERFSLELGR